MPVSNDSPDSGVDRRESWRSILSTVLALVLAPLIAIMLSLFIFQSYQVEGMSMERSLQNEDRLIIVKLPRTWSRITHHSYIPARYDIVVFSSRLLGKQLIKRVIGLPGDRVVIADGKVTIYNTDHPEGFAPDANQPYAANLPQTPGYIDVTVPDNDIFVLGDNRSNSEDSSEFGPIAVRDIIGKLSVRVLPLDGFKLF